VGERMTVSTLAPRARRKMVPPAPPHPVTQYALDVIAGRVVSGAYVKRAAERHIADLSSGHARGLWFDEAAATKAVQFFGLLRHYKGDLGKADGGKGAFVHLEAWQQFIVGSAFGWKRADGLRRFRRVYVEVAKKNGKTLLGAGLMLLLAFFDGEPGAEAYSIATKEEQAKLSWNDGVQFVAKNASIAQRIRKVGKRLVNEQTASFWAPLGRDSDIGEQGINAHSGLVDELHVLDSQDPIDNLETATSSRSQPMIVYITTAGVKRESVWATMRADAISVVEGRATDDSMLVAVYTLDEGDDPFDEAVWPKSNPNLGVSVRVDTLREQAEQAKRSPGKLAPFLRFRMNVPTGVATRAIDIDEWDRNSGLEEGEDYHAWEARVFADRRTLYAGLDLASVRDLTADIFVARDAEGYYDVLCRFFCPEEGIEHRSKVDGVPYADWVRDGYLIATPGNVTDYDFIKAENRDLADRHEILETGYDRWNATQLATDLQAEGAKLIVIPQTSAGLAPGWRELEKAILEHKLRHGGHPILRWMAGNVEVETDAAGNQKPSKRLSSERIDGMVALDMAVGRWMVHVEEVEADVAVFFGRAR
jgi:phage terminase large subunit-like protein